MSYNICSKGHNYYGETFYSVPLPVLYEVLVTHRYSTVGLNRLKALSKTQDWTGPKPVLSAKLNICMDRNLVLYCVVHQNLMVWRQARRKILPLQQKRGGNGYFWHNHSLHTCILFTLTSTSTAQLKTFSYLHE